MLFYQWIAAALGVIVVYMLLGYGWAVWVDRRAERMAPGDD